jgi:hypothetical protein
MVYCRWYQLDIPIRVKDVNKKTRKRRPLLSAAQALQKWSAAENKILTTWAGMSSSLLNFRQPDSFRQKKIMQARGNRIHKKQRAGTRGRKKWNASAAEH